MDATAKSADTLHRVKRPYTRKVSTKEENVRLEGVDVGVQYDDEVAVPHPINVSRIATAQQAYALRVWGGHSVDVPVHERLERVRNALNGQNLPHDGVILDGHAL